MPIFEESCEHYRNLYKKMVQCTKEVLTLNDLMDQMKQAHEQFSTNLEGIATKFHEQISGEREDDDDGLLLAYQHLSNYLLKLSASQSNLSRNIASEIIDPFKMFIENFRQTNRETCANAKDWLTEISKKRERLTEAQQKFWMNRKKAEEYTDLIEKTADAVEKGSRPKGDLQKVTHRSVELKFLAEESQEEYRNCINHANLEWETFAKHFPSIFSRFEYNEESRIAFSRQTIMKLIQYMAQQNSLDLNSSLAYTDKFHEYEKQLLLHSRPTTEAGKPLTKSTATHTSFQDRLTAFSEKFISFEAWKKSQEPPADSESSQQEQYPSEEDRRRIEIAIQEILDPVKNNLTSSRKSNAGSSTSGRSSLNSSMIDESSSQVTLRSLLVQLPSQDIADNRSEASFDGENYIVGGANTSTSSNALLAESIFPLLSHEPSCEYFLDRLCKRVSSSGRFHLELVEDKFIDLSETLQSILHTFSISDSLLVSPETFQNLLTVVTRIIKRQKQNQPHKECLARLLNSNQIFYSTQQWENLFDFVKTKKLEEKKRQSDSLKDEEPAILNKNIKKGIMFIGAGLGKLGGLFQKQRADKPPTEEERAMESETSYSVLEELNRHLLNLELSSQFTSDLIIDLANRKGAKLELISKLLEKQENKKNSEMRRNFSVQSKQQKKKSLANNSSNMHSANRMQALIYLIKQVMPYLSTDDRPWRLLLVCKAFRDELRKPLFEIYLFNDAAYSWLETNRVKAWMKALATEYLPLDYIEMKSEVAMKAKHDPIDEIINLDVNRSLHMHQDKINASQLRSLLRVFAYYNPSISYCQGMNYIAGFLYLTILDESESYKAFHAIMKKNFSVLLADNFEQLKMVFYQLERLLSIFLPELADHLKQEGVDANYYATSWFITLFSSVYQYTRHSYLLCAVWDIFICEGWKGFFKCVLWIQRQFAAKLLKLEFDEILHTMSDMIRQDIFLYSREDLIAKGILTSAESLKAQIKAIKITNSLLSNLESEYSFFQLNLKQKLAAITQ